MKRPFSVVYFKKDLRLVDQEAVFRTAQHPYVRYIYIFEPSFWRHPTASYKHYCFLRDCLRDLSNELLKKGRRLEVFVNEAEQVFKDLFEQGLAEVHSLEETGHNLSYQRDLELRELFGTLGVKWSEYQCNGVFRGKLNRDEWAQRRDAYMSQPLFKGLENRRPQNHSPYFPGPESLGIEVENNLDIQEGGRKEGLRLLQTFLDSRGEYYSSELSSPISAEWSCSRLSPFLSFGALSMREVVQKVAHLRLTLPAKTPWRGALAAFSSRLYWHCHFIQKLEQQPSIEYACMHPAFEKLGRETNGPKLEAWKEGKTGYPFIDACIHFLVEKGWINFRMRAMLASFAAYDLWLDWREYGKFLARHFTDYEPGIHYSQLQMQAGTTSINAMRIYDPIKQSLDQDPKGEFIKKWVPELERVPYYYIHEPWKMSRYEWEEYGLEESSPYLNPIVDHKTAITQAKSAFSEIRKEPNFKKIQAEIKMRLGSRKRRHLQTPKPNNADWHAR